MSKFKFGQKVWHEEYGLCVITICNGTSCGIAHNHPARAQVPYLIDECELSIASEFSIDSDWTLCKEKMPKSQGLFLCFGGGDGYTLQFTAYLDNGKWLDVDGHEIKFTVTHWMALPPRPRD